MSTYYPSLCFRQPVKSGLQAHLRVAVGKRGFCFWLTHNLSLSFTPPIHLFHTLTMSFSLILSDWALFKRKAPKTDCTRSPAPTEHHRLIIGFVVFRHQHVCALSVPGAHFSSSEGSRASQSSDVSVEDSLCTCVGWTV